MRNPIVESADHKRASARTADRYFRAQGASDKQKPMTAIRRGESQSRFELQCEIYDLVKAVRAGIRSSANKTERSAAGDALVRLNSIALRGFE